MSVLLISSREDPASTNIKKGLLSKSVWMETDGLLFTNPIYRHKDMDDIIMVTLPDDKKTIVTEGIDDAVLEKLGEKIEQIIYLSRHRAKSGKPTLTTHPIGNYGPALFGGRTRTLCPSSPRMMSALLCNIARQRDLSGLNHPVCYEVTHHGPYTTVPTLFVEVGSTETEWVKSEPADVIAQALLDTLYLGRYERDYPEDTKVLIGIGGGHYAPRFTDMALLKKVAFGHMIPNYHVDQGNIDRAIIRKAYQQTPDCSGCYIHKKGLHKAQVREYKDMLEELGIPLISSKELEEKKH